MQRAGAPDQGCQAFGRAPSRDEAEVHLRKADSRMGRCYAEVARERELCPSTECVAVEGGDDGHAQDVQAVERGAHRSRHLRGLLGRAHVLELLQVAACAERLVACAANDQHARPLRFRLVERQPERPHGGQVQRVAGLGPIDGDRGHAALDSEG